MLLDEICARKFKAMFLFIDDIIFDTKTAEQPVVSVVG